MLSFARSFISYHIAINNRCLAKFRKIIQNIGQNKELLAQNNDKNVFDSIMVLRFSETKVAIEEFYGAKKAIKIWDIDVHNIVISKLV